MDLPPPTTLVTPPPSAPVAVALPRLTLRVDAESPLPALSGGTLAVAADGGFAVVADPDRDAVYVVELASDSVRTVTFPRGSEPGRVVLDDNGRAHVSLRSAGAIARIELRSATLEQSLAICQFPRGVAYAAATASLWIACADGDLVRLDARSYDPQSRHFVARDLRDVVVADSGGLRVSRYRSAELLRLTADGILEAQAAPPTVFLGTGGTQGQPTDPALAWRTIRGTDGAPWMLHERAQNNDITPSDGYGGICGRIMQPALTRFDASGAPDLNMRLTSSLVLPVDLANSADGMWIAVADPSGYLAAKPTVIVFPTTAATRDGAIDTSSTSAPCGWSVAAAGLLPDGQATSVAFDQAGSLYAFSREPARLDVFDVSQFRDLQIPDARVSALHAIKLADTSARDTGHDLFHAPTRSGVSCASCHGEALDDGRVWNFRDVGKRRTQNLRAGGILATLPLDWSGDHKDVSSLLDDVWINRMSGIPLESAHKVALGHWLERLPSLQLRAADEAAAERGRLLFASPDTGCATCHGGAAFTDNQSAEVGTGGSFQVPSLRGLALRPPYMHDGCAPTLENQFSLPCFGGERHGHTAQLTQKQRADLISYLDTL